MATDTVQNSVYVGPVLRGDGNGGSGLRASRNGGLVVTPEAPALYEPASRGVIFSCSTALTGTTVVAANNSGVAGGAGGGAPRRRGATGSLGRLGGGCGRVPRRRRRC